MDEFIIQLITRLDTADAVTDLNKLKEQLKKEKINLETVLDTSASKQQLQNLAKQIQSVLNQKYPDLKIDTRNVLSSLNQVIKDVNNATSKANKIQLSIDTGGYETKVNSLIVKTQQWTDQNGNARISTDNLSNAMHELTEASNAYANNKSEETQKRLIQSSEKLDTEYKKIANSVKTMNAELAKDSTVSSLHNQVSEFMSKNGKTVKYFGTDLKSIFDQTVQGSKLSNQELAKLKQKFIEVQNAARNSGKIGKTWFQTLREGISPFSYLTSSTFLVMKAIQSVKSGISTVKELDTALVDLKKTTTMTASELEQFYYDSNDVAKQMGVTTEEIINQASAWSRFNKIDPLYGDI